ncbi:hypothetical protein CEXT_726451 [Caerostris extrusa]|uniref:Uncharacterized protein n=1 Tax=Caerostris extrusa TaxID=172846 RepID=A0AAV4PJB1_CAEEX|nr:hypothetical protein CEXT_726451 [Caerostris extrusa]
MTQRSVDTVTPDREMVRSNVVNIRRCPAMIGKAAVHCVRNVRKLYCLALNGQISEIWIGTQFHSPNKHNRTPIDQTLLPNDITCWDTVTPDRKTDGPNVVKMRLVQR